MTKGRLISAVLLFIAILATIAFIFSNSMKSPTESQEDSNTIGDIIAEIIPPDTELGSFLQENLRKLAHFTEYSLLGVEVTLFLIAVAVFSVKTFISSAFFGFLIGLADETIQIFSERGSSVTDVWIDGIGYLIAATVVTVLYGFVCLIGKICKR